jgi:hypothetical protein
MDLKKGFDQGGVLQIHINLIIYVFLVVTSISIGINVLLWLVLWFTYPPLHWCGIVYIYVSKDQWKCAWILFSLIQLYFLALFSQFYSKQIWQTKFRACTTDSMVYVLRCHNTYRKLNRQHIQ